MRSLRRLFSNSLSSSLKEKFYCGHWELSFPFLFSVSLIPLSYAFSVENFDFGSSFVVCIYVFGFPFAFLSTFLFVLYALYRLAKLMNMAELQRNPQKKEYIGDFFRFLFFPIGVWSLQPRVNRLFEQCKTDSKVDFGSPRYREVWLLLRYPCLAILTLLGFLVLMNLVLLICVK